MNKDLFVVRYIQYALDRNFDVEIKPFFVNPIGNSDDFNMFIYSNLYYNKGKTQ